MKPTELMEFPIEARNEILKLSAELARCRKDTLIECKADLDKCWAENEHLKKELDEWRKLCIHLKELARFMPS